MNVLEASREMIVIMVDAAWDVAGTSKEVSMEDVYVDEGPSMTISMEDADADGWSPRKEEALKLSTHKHYESRKREDGGRGRET